MFKVTITNELTGASGGTTLPTVEEVDAFVAHVLAKEYSQYGKPERTLTFENSTDFAIQHPELVDRVLEATAEDIYNSIPVYQKDENGDNVLVPVLDEENNPVLDEFGNPLYQAVQEVDGEGHLVFEQVFSHTLYHYRVKADYVISEVEDLTEQYKQQAKRDYAKLKINSGMEIVTYMHELNSSFSGEQLYALMQSFKDLIVLLMSGSLETPYGVISQMEISPPLTQDYKDKILAKIAQEVAKLPPEPQE